MGIDESRTYTAIVSGHPYLVRLALYHIARGDISLDKLLETAATDGGIYGDHLRRHLWTLQQRPELAKSAKKVVSAAEPIQLDSMQGFKLHSIGIVNLQGNLVKPRRNLYRCIWVHCNFEENQKLTAFWEWGIGNGELERKSFCKYEMLPMYLSDRLSKI